MKPPTLAEGVRLRATEPLAISAGSGAAGGGPTDEVVSSSCLIF